MPSKHDLLVGGYYLTAHAETIAELEAAIALIGSRGATEAEKANACQRAITMGCLISLYAFAGLPNEEIERGGDELEADVQAVRDVIAARVEMRRRAIVERNAKKRAAGLN